MTFEQATQIMKAMDPTGRNSLIKGCQEVKAMLAKSSNWQDFEDVELAYRTVCREMSKLFV